MEKFKEIVKAWQFWLVVIGLCITSYGYLMEPISKYLKVRDKQDSIRTIQYVNSYIVGFQQKVEHLDSLDEAIIIKLAEMEKKDSTSKAVGIRALPNGIFAVRDEWQQAHESFRYTIKNDSTGWVDVFMRYRDRTDGIEYHILLKSYYDK